MSAISVERQFTGMDTLIRFETGLLAPQAHGAVVARLGETMVLATATTSKAPKDGVDFFPLTVDVEERMYAAGKIPGSFFRREGRASDQAILTCRLIDRPLRPCFPDGFRNDVHVVVTILGADLVNPHDVLSINAASAALMMSGIPFEGPIGAVRIALGADGRWIPFPTYQEGDESSFELVVAGRMTSDGSDVAVMMVEAGGTEATWQAYEAKGAVPTEEVVAAGLVEAKRWIAESIALQQELIAQATPREPMTWSPVRDYSDEIAEAVSTSARAKLVVANAIADKTERASAIEAVNSEVQEELAPRFEDQAGAIKAALRSLLKQVVRERIVNDGVRIDGRDTVTIRPLSAAVGLIPTAHGSGLFQRGETQVLNICTLGMPRMNQQLDTLGVDEFKRYMHHYNMPPFASGEPGFMRGPKRREIGHGLLAERALLPVVPSEEKFSYALRLVSEVLSSNGSTSMASVCGSTLSLMDAGVPIKAPVGGIAMGLIYEGGKYITLTDILGAEDAFGDMDFKVAGTRDFVTALQLDTKIDGIPAEVLAAALKQAHTARMQIIDVIEQTLSAPRAEVAATAPRIVTMQIPMDKIGEIIGPKGKNINAMQLETGCDISVDDDGTVGRVVIGSRDGAMVKEVQRRIELILNPPEATLGAVYEGKVVGITKFGAFVNILPGRDGLVHISKLGRGRRIDRVEDVLELNQEVRVRVDEIDPSGKLALSLVDDDAAAAPDTSAPEPRAERKPSPAPAAPPVGNRVSFEDTFESELAREIGDLG